MELINLQNKSEGILCAERGSCAGALSDACRAAPLCHLRWYKEAIVQGWWESGRYSFKASLVRNVSLFY